MLRFSNNTVHMQQAQSKTGSHSAAWSCLPQNSRGHPIDAVRNLVASTDGGHCCHLLGHMGVMHKQGPNIPSEDCQHNAGPCHEDDTQPYCQPACTHHTYFSYFYPYFYFSFRFSHYCGKGAMVGLQQLCHTPLQLRAQQGPMTHAPLPTSGCSCYVVVWN